MRYFFLALLLVMTSACGHKGGLKTPAQIEHERQKQERKATQESDQQQEKQQELPAGSN